MLFGLMEHVQNKDEKINALKNSVFFCWSVKYPIVKLILEKRTPVFWNTLIWKVPIEIISPRRYI